MSVDTVELFQVPEFGIQLQSAKFQEEEEGSKSWFKHKMTASLHMEGSLQTEGSVLASVSKCEVKLKGEELETWGLKMERAKFPRVVWVTIP